MSSIRENDKNGISRGKFFLILLSLVMPALFACLGTGAVDAYAANIGTITVNGSTKTYSDFEKLTDDLAGYKDKTVTIDMLSD